MKNKDNSLTITKELVSGSGDIDRNTNNRNDGIKKAKNKPTMVYTEPSEGFFMESDLIKYKLSILLEEN